LRFRAIADSLGIILMFFSITFVVPFAAILYYWDLSYDPATQLRSCEEGWRTIISFLIPAVLCLVVGGALRIFGRGYSEDIRDREAFFVVGVGWLVIAFLGCLPFLISGTLTNFFDAYFESMSGFTTTGATVLEIPGGAPEGADYLDAYPHSVMLWRSFICWLGGMGIIVLSIVILSKFLGGGSSLMDAEVSGPTSTRLKPRIAQTARSLFIVYMTLTIITIALFRIVGMDGFDAVNHTFTTLATAGFSTHYSSIAYYDNALIELAITLFMFIAGINFAIHYKLIAGIGDKRKLLRDPEMTFYTLIITFAVFLITIILIGARDIGTWDSFRMSLFQTVSIITTTGYSTTDFSLWPESTQFIILLLMLTGGCAGSTGGAIKVIRLLILTKLIRREVRRAVRSRAVMSINIGENSLPENVVQAVAMFFIIYIMMFIFGSFLFMMMGYDMITSISTAATSLGNVGPALGKFGPAFTYQSMPFYGKLLMALLMWLGRLEIMAGFILMFPSSYKE